MRRSALLVVVALLVGAGAPAAANDSAASIAAGGIILRDEKRVSMRKELLTISPSTISVEYEFVNESPADVTTEVAFPVPEYRYGFDALEGPLDLGGFRAWVDGSEINVTKQVRALVAGKDHAPVLHELGVDVEHHGNYDPTDWQAPGRPNQIASLSSEALERLVSLGLVEPEKPERGWPRWTVAITWHWTQTFPAGRAVKVRHEYTPAVGHRGFPDGKLPAFGSEFPDACAGDALVRAQARAVASAQPGKPAGHRWFTVRWVNYILSTARSWKTPIPDFELIVEGPAASLVTFCWDGRVEKVGESRFRAKAKDFVPSKELTVYFLQAN